MEARRWDEALKAFVKAADMTADKEQQCAVQSLVSACSMRLGHWELAAQSSARALEADPDNICRLKEENLIRNKAAGEWMAAPCRSRGAFESCCVEISARDGAVACCFVPAKTLLVEAEPFAEKRGDAWIDVEGKEIAWDLEQAELPTDVVPVQPTKERQVLAFRFLRFFKKSCTPNCAVVFWDIRALVVALRDLEPGELLTISRIPTLLKHSPGKVMCRCSLYVPPEPMETLHYKRSDGIPLVDCACKFLGSLVARLPQSLESICCFAWYIVEKRRCRGRQAVN